MDLALPDDRHGAGADLGHDVVDRLRAAALADEDQLVVAVAMRLPDRALADAEALEQHDLDRRRPPQPVDADGLLSHAGIVTSAAPA